MTAQYSILVVAACPFPYPRGTPLRILRMAESLAARGHHVEVAAYHLEQRLEDLPFPVHRIPALPTYRKYSPGPTYQKLFVLDTLLAGRIFSLARGGRFDVIHAHHYEGLLASLPAARLLRIPLVFDVHTLLSTELPLYSMGLPPAWLRGLGGALDRSLPPLADHIVAVTNSIREKLIAQIHIVPDRVTTVYSGLEADHFKGARAADIRAEPDTLIYTGNLAEYQGIDLMLRALRRVLDRRPAVRLKIVSDWELAPYEGLIRELRLEEALELIRADYFHLPQQLHTASVALSPRVVCDGLPLKTLNYMATGRAIVSFQGSAEVLEHRRTALIVPDRDIAAFASAILELLDNPGLAGQLGENARAHVEEFFLWESAVQRLEEIYRTILRPRPPR